MKSLDKMECDIGTRVRKIDSKIILNANSKKFDLHQLSKSCRMKLLDDIENKY